MVRMLSEKVAKREGRDQKVLCSKSDSRRAVVDNEKIQVITMGVQGKHRVEVKELTG